MLTLRMLNAFLHTVCYAPNDTIQQAAGFRCPALEVVSQLWAYLIRSEVSEVCMTNGQACMVSPQIRMDPGFEGSPVNIWSNMLCTSRWMESIMLISDCSGETRLVPTRT